MTNFLSEAMEMIMSEEKNNVRIGAFERTGCLIELSNRCLGDGSFSDDLIRPQGLAGKYEVPPVPPATAVVADAGDVVVNCPDVVELPDDIDAIQDEDNVVVDLLNDYLEINDDFNDTKLITEESLVPEGIDFDDEETVSMKK